MPRTPEVPPVTPPDANPFDWSVWPVGPAAVAVLVDAARRVVAATPAADARLGRPVGRRLDDLLPRAAADRLPAVWDAMLSDGTVLPDCELTTAGGPAVAAALHLRPNLAAGLHLAEFRPAAPARPVVLVAEDEDIVRGMVRLVLEQDGFEVLAAETGGRAAELFQDRPAGVDVLLTDVRMPGMTGPELARHLRADRPDLPVVFMSGYVGDAVCGYDADLARSEFVAKPFRLDDLRKAVRRALRQTAAV
jgi:CheY-like chemotaxis protein